MSNDLDLPPFTSIPSEVRDRVRRKVQERVRRPRSYRRPLAVAAGVALLAAATVFVFAKGSSPSEPARPNRTDMTLDRCWNAIHHSGAQTSDYPDRATWQVPVVNDMAPYLDVVVVGISAGGRKFFCEATPMTVNISWPLAELHYAPGTRTALMMVTPNGTVAGVIDPSWPAGWFSDPGRTQSHEVARDGMFIFNTERSLVNATILTRRAEKVVDPDAGSDYSGTELPKPPTLGVSIQDRQAPLQERTSPGGKALGDCMTRASGVVMDPDTYGAGAMITKDKAMMVMALSPSQVAACHISPTEPNSPDLADFALGPKLSDVDGGEAPVAFYPGPVNLPDGARSTLGGILPKRAARMELRFGNGVTVTPEVVNRTFALIIPDQVVVGGDNEIADAGKITVRLFGTSGGVSYEGPLTIWHPN